VTTITIRKLHTGDLTVVRVIELGDRRLSTQRSTVMAEMIEFFNGGEPPRPKHSSAFTALYDKAHKAAAEFGIPSYALAFEEEGFTMEFGP
jgi:hypothetical protein